MALPELSEGLAHHSWGPEQEESSPPHTDGNHTYAPHVLGFRGHAPHSLSSLQWFRESGKPWTLRPPHPMTLPVPSFRPILVLLHQSLSPFRVDKSPRPVPAPSSQLPAPSFYKPLTPCLWQTHFLHKWAGCLHPTFCPKVFSSQVPSSRMFHLMRAKRLEICPSILTFIHLLTHPFSYTARWVSIHTSSCPFIHIHPHTHLFMPSLIPYPSSIYPSDHLILDQRTTA